MYCRNCGAQIEDGSRFCPKCGTEQFTEGTKAKASFQGVGTIYDAAPLDNAEKEKLVNRLLDLEQQLKSIELNEALADVYEADADEMEIGEEMIDLGTTFHIMYHSNDLFLKLALPMIIASYILCGLWFNGMTLMLAIVLSITGVAYELSRPKAWRRRADRLRTEAKETRIKYAAVLSALPNELQTSDGVERVAALLSSGKAVNQQQAIAMAEQGF